MASLQAATNANVQNNMVALLTAGGLALLATLLFTLRDPQRSSRSPVQSQKVWWGIGFALALYAGGLVIFWAASDWFVDDAHYAAFGLFVCIVLVVTNNGFRKDEQTGYQDGAQGWKTKWGRIYLAIALSMI